MYSSNVAWRPSEKEQREQRSEKGAEKKEKR
jgi:hypothetical protein